jgi:hypothetical protein
MKSRKTSRAAALLIGAALSLAVTSQLQALPDTAPEQPVRFLDSLPSTSGVEPAVEAFVRGMVTGNAAEVWRFATEEEQDAFQTERAALAAYSDAFPALTRAKEATLVRTWDEGDDTFVAVLLRDRAHHAYQADMGFWLDDAGDWRIVSLDVRDASDLTAGL